MSGIGRGVDALQLLLTGGVSNTDPNQSLGGIASSTKVWGLGAIVNFPLIPALRIDQVYPACGVGTATLALDMNGNLVFTPPGGSPGTPVAPIPGGNVIVSGSNPSQAINVYCEVGLIMQAGMSMTFQIVGIMRGVLSQHYVSNAGRVAGLTTYRALMLYTPGLYGVQNVRLWMPSVAGSQATFSLALEYPPGGLVTNRIQTIALETTAPSGRTWVTPTTEGAALTISSIDVGQYVGLWIRKVFPPAGRVNPQENFQLAFAYMGA